MLLIRDIFVCSSRNADLACAARFASFADSFILFFQRVKLFIGKLLDIDEIIIGGMVRAYQLIELQMQRLGVTVLRVLDQKDDQKRNDGCAGINNELPGVRKMKERAADRPGNQYDDGGKEHIRMTDKLCGCAGKAAEPEIESF